MFNLPLVFRSTIKCYQIEHLSHSGAESVSITIFDFRGGKVGGNVRDRFVFDKLFVPADQYLSHNVAIVSEMLDLLFGTQIVKAITG